MKKILVVDNDKEILDVVEFMLTQSKFEVKTVSQWQLVSRTVEDFVPDLILMDIDLEGADGGDICKDIKSSDSHYDIPVILISVHAMPKKYVRACDAQGFLQKPFDVSNLNEIIKKNLN